MAVAASGETHVVALTDRRATDSAAAGAKAARLAVLMREGFPLPEGVVVTTRACARIAAGEISAELRAEIAEAVRALGGGTFAVRSSAVDEDSSTASYAGQYTSVLNVSSDRANADAVVAAICEVVASGDTERVRAYRARLGRSDACPVAVLVQRQVPADAAGVAFTADPVTGDVGVTLVNAVRGLGDRLVNGEATPQQWVVRAGAAECVASGEGIVLTAAQALAVAELAERIAAQAGAPQDVEWAIAGDVVHLLQARPITALPVPPAVDLPAGTWIKETGRRTDLITPFGASIALPLVSDGLAAAFAEAGSLVERIEMRSVGGEVYLRVVPVGGHTGAPPPWWALAILARVAPPLRARCTAARSSVDARTVETLVSRWYTEWRPQILESLERLVAADVKAMSDAELAAHLSESIELLRHGLNMHFRLVPPYALTLYRLASTCRELLDWGLAETLALLDGASAATSEPTRALAEVATLVSDPGAVKQVLARPGADLGARLHGVDEKAADAFDAWCERYAGRVLGEDPGAPTLAEQPAMLAGLFAAELARAESAADLDPVRDDRQLAAERARAALARRSAADRARFEEALAAAATAYPTREDTAVWAACHPAGLVRRAVVDAGRRLVDAGLLDRTEDAVLLDVETVLASLRGTRDGVRDEAMRRRAERAWVAAHPGPRFHGAPPSPSPDVRGLPAAAREMNTALLWTQQHQHPQGHQQASQDQGLRDGAVRGAPGAPGRYTGPVRIVRHFSELGRIAAGDVVVCPATDPSWSVLFAVVGALVTEGGGALSHAAIVAREHGVPAVLAVPDATRTWSDGEIVTVDGTAGTVTARASQGEK